MKVTFRSYEPKDRGGCKAVFDSNVPRYFAESERQEFLDFIDETKNPYWVLESDGQIIGCGGYGFRDRGDTADLCWGMIASDLHGRRLGEFLMTARLIEILSEHEIEAFRVATSQHTESFFEKYGFRAERRVQDGFAAGLDRIEMRLTVTPDHEEDLLRKWNSVRHLVENI